MISVHALYKIKTASTSANHPQPRHTSYDRRSVNSAGLPRTFCTPPLQSRPNANSAPSFYGTFTFPSSVGAILTPARVVKILTDGCSDTPSGGA